MKYRMVIKDIWIYLAQVQMFHLSNYNNCTKQKRIHHGKTYLE